MAGQENVCLWQPETGELRTLPIQGILPFGGLAYSRDGKALAVAWGKNVYLWNSLTNGGDSQQLVGDRGRINDIAFSRDGRTLAVANEGGIVTLWHVATRRQMLVLEPAPGGSVSEIDFSPDGSLLAAACTMADGKGRVALWRTAER
jgi:WD40 repeat protein